MKFWKDAKEAYRSIQPPEELEETIRAGVRTAERIQRERRQKSRPVTRYAVCGAAALCMIFVVAVNAIVGQPDIYSGFYVFCGMLFYAAELYADFTGGIDITIGIAQMFGIQLAENFERPYF